MEEYDFRTLYMTNGSTSLCDPFLNSEVSNSIVNFAMGLLKHTVGQATVLTDSLSWKLLNMLPPTVSPVSSEPLLTATRGISDQFDR